MPLDVYFKPDITNGLKACMVLAISTVMSQGLPNVEFLNGVLAFAQAQANLYGLNWQKIITDIKQQSQLDATVFDLIQDVNG